MAAGLLIILVAEWLLLPQLAGSWRDSPDLARRRTTITAWRLLLTVLGAGLMIVLMLEPAVLPVGIARLLSLVLVVCGLASEAGWRARFYQSYERYGV